ncbi:MAG TPA: hypothetical protein VE527_09310 [Reyranella sp.]|jgi:hypothetical protein|nr:hypothetical protein [Reyranella sp.]
MTLRRLRSAVCLLAVLSIGTTVLPAWAADHDANNCAAGGGGGSGGGGGGGSGAGSGGSAGSTGGEAAASGVGVGPAANSVAPADNGGVRLGIRSGIGGVGNGGVGGSGGGGIDAGGDPFGATSLQGARPYSLRAIYFRRDQFRSASDCLTAAHTRRLPLEVCQ